MSRLDPRDVAVIVSELGALKYFPADKDARTAIAKDIADICPNLEEAWWLAKRMRELFNDWPGPSELRAVYASRKIHMAPSQNFVNCLTCRDTGWIIGNYKTANFCNCPAGRKYRKEWKARQTQETQS